MTGMISANVKKIKATSYVNQLLDENYRTAETAKEYDDGHRIIDTEATAENVFLIARPDNYDRFRRDRIERVNEARAKRTNYDLAIKSVRNKLKDEGLYKKERSKESAGKRKLRSDTVDTLGIVIQPSEEFIKALPREEQTRFFRDALAVMQSSPDYFGWIETAVIHYDENTPHMQCLATTINEETLTSDANRITGNKSKMSNRQTFLAKEMQKRGWDVERGMKRIDNPEYKNFKSEMEQMGIKVNRFNDAALIEVWREITQKTGELNSREESLDTRESNLNSRNKTIQSAEKEIKAKAEELEAKSLDQEKLLQEKKNKLQGEENKLQAMQVRANTLQVQLQEKANVLNSREKALKGQEQAQKQLAKELSIKEQKAQESANTALEYMNAGEELWNAANKLLDKMKRLTEPQKREIYSAVTKIIPKTSSESSNIPEKSSDALEAARQLQAALDGLSPDDNSLGI